MGNDDRCAVQRLEAAAGRANADRFQSVVGEVLGAGGNVVDAEYQCIRSDDIHDCYLPFCEYVSI